MLDLAFSEIARLHEEVEILNVRLDEASDRRREAEENWQRAEEQAEQAAVEGTRRMGATVTMTPAGRRDEV